MTRSTVKKIDIYDRAGVFVVMGEGPTQAPIILETEGEDSSFESAQKRMASSPFRGRMCICRVVPVLGNELLALDMVRLQGLKQEEEPF